MVIGRVIAWLSGVLDCALNHLYLVLFLLVELQNQLDHSLALTIHLPFMFLCLQTLRLVSLYIVKRRLLLVLDGCPALLRSLLIIRLSRHLCDCYASRYLTLLGWKQLLRQTALHGNTLGVWLLYVSRLAVCG